MPDMPDETSTPSSRPWVGSAPPPTGRRDDQPSEVALDRSSADADGTTATPVSADEDDHRGRARHRDRDHESLSSFLKELPVLLLIAFGLAFLLRTFVVQVFYIPSESMVPTLEVDDRIVVEKISYLFDGPDRGDVVVFAGEAGFPTAGESGVQRVVRGVGQFLGVVPVDARDLVKRVIGLPGDTVELSDGQVRVNGVALDEPYAVTDSDTGTYEVPEGQLFVLGDNRNNSADSRSALGFVDLDDVVGRAALKIWPLDRFGGIEGADYPAIPEGDDASTTGAVPSAAAPSGALPGVGFVVRRRAPSAASASDAA